MAEEKQLTPEESTFRNEAYATIKGLMSENTRLKDAYGRAVKQKKATARGLSNVKGFQQLKSF